MRRITRDEVFSSDRPYEVKTLADKAFINEAFMRSSAWEKDDKVQKVILENFFLQKALIDELIVIDDETADAVSLNCQFFAGEALTAEELLSVLKRVYGTIMPIEDKNGEIIGYHVSDTSQAALDSAKELYDEGKLDDFIYRFVSLPGKGCYAHGKECSESQEELFGEAEKTSLPEKDVLSIENSDFYKTASDFIKHAGMYAFFANKQSFYDLEGDACIQGLIDLGHRVYIWRAKGDGFFSIYVE